ncbi:MAG: exonuclease SbcCD subunit D [Rhodothermia bacterium]|nr:exonuclease SbcCD subunit D [Rhodothermia bacterium]
MLRVLHIADVHFDTTFSCRSDELRSRLREAIRQSFVRAMDMAVEDGVHAVIVAGDLFDGSRLSFTTEKILVEQFRRLGDLGIRVFYACGNHDPASLRSRAGSIALPDNCTVFDSARPETVEIQDESGAVIGRVTGAGHETAKESRNLASTFPAVKGDVPHVAVLHTMVTSASSSESHDRYAPCSVDDLASRGYDYWALGHIHHRQAVDAEQKAWYPGSIQGRNPKETGARGGLLVDVFRARPPQVRFVPLAPLEWASLHVESLAGVQNLSDLEQAVAKAWEENSQSSGDARDAVVVVHLQGACPIAEDLVSRQPVEEIEALLADHLSVIAVEVRTSGLHQPIEIESYRGEPHVLGELLRLISRYEEEPESIERIAPKPLAAQVSSNGERSEYLRKLLSGLDREAAARLLDV